MQFDAVEGVGLAAERFDHDGIGYNLILDVAENFEADKGHMKRCRVVHDEPSFARYVLE
ncbi:hypothetical protein D3C72_2021640 [compost metagenome]